MNKIQFDSKGIYASSPDLASIGHQYLEELRREEARRQKIREGRLPDMGQSGIWNISDRD